MARPRTIPDDVVLARVRDALFVRGLRASLADLAYAAGLTAPGLLRRFNSRDELVVKSLELPSVPAWVALLEGGPDERPLHTQLHDILAQLDAFFTAMMPRLTALRESGCARKKNAPRAFAALRGWLERARERGLVRHLHKDADVAAAAELIIGAAHARAFYQHVVEQRAPIRASAAQLRASTDLVVAALTPARKDSAS
ncbi:MAG TPA: hypothetical protein VGO62_03030 [Myxococcota bacterium]|jgi:AcrR family transcriptional regulator